MPNHNTNGDNAFVAFIATRNAPEPQALIVGMIKRDASETTPGEDWRYAITTIKQALACLKDRKALYNLLCNADQSQPSPLRQAPDYLPVGTGITRSQSRIFDNVERIQFYRNDRQPMTNPPYTPPTPFFVLDTCRGRKATKIAPFDSCIVLALPKGESGDRVSGAFQALRLYALFRLVGNWHYDSTANEFLGWMDGLVKPVEAPASQCLFRSPDCDTSHKSTIFFDKLTFGLAGGVQPEEFSTIFKEHFNIGLTGLARKLYNLSIRRPIEKNISLVEDSDDSDGCTRCVLQDILTGGDNFSNKGTYRGLGFNFIPSNSDIIDSIVLRFDSILDTTEGLPIPEHIFKPFDSIGIFPFANTAWGIVLEQSQDILTAGIAPAYTSRWALSLYGLDFDEGNYHLSNLIRWQNNDTPADVGFATWWNDKVGRIKNSLRLTNATSGLSFLPTLSPEKNQGFWAILASLTDKNPNARPCTAKEYNLSICNIYTPDKNFFWCSHALFKQQDRSHVATFSGIKWKDSLPQTSHANALAYEIKIQQPQYAFPCAATDNTPPATNPPIFFENDRARGVYFQFELTRPAPSTKQATFRLGALDIRIGGALAAGGTEPLKCCIRVVPGGSGGSIDPYGFGVEAAINLPVETILPGGEDEPPGEARVDQDERATNPFPLAAALHEVPQTPLCIPLPPSMAQAAPPADAAGGDLPGGTRNRIRLQATEISGLGQTHDLTLALSAIDSVSADRPGGMAAAPQADSNRLLLLSFQPFFIAEVRYPDITGLGRNENNEVAVWAESPGEGKRWRIHDPRETISLRLPPQTIGEAMEKGKTFGTFQNEQGALPADYRLGSLTSLEVDPTYFKTDYTDPPWNLRRIFGYPGQRAPGAGLRRLRLELLYGLVAAVATSDVQVAELGSLLGFPAAKVAPLAVTNARSTPHYDLARYIEWWNKIRDVVDARPSLLRLLRAGQEGELVLDRDVAFRLRTKSVHYRCPVHGAAPPGLSGMFTPDGLPGGVAWAFESANIISAVYRRPEADEGALAGVSLTPLGGFGRQRALFDERRTKIASVTGLGRVHRLVLERVGRVSCLWNKAKHVIVYERTVVPPKQFYNDQEQSQEELAGRPILRKIEEYVEILEPVRRFPEKGGTVAAAGFVLRGEFKTQKILVDSDWGHDVRDEGWEVPLWNERFASSSSAVKDKPGIPPSPSAMTVQVYAKPQVQLGIMGEDGLEHGVEIDEPHKLYFYTAVGAGLGDDTNAWPAVQEVDFSDLPPPTEATGSQTPITPTDQAMSKAPEVAPGYDRFTLALARTPVRACLGHGRTASSPAAPLRNVTLARAAARRAGEGVIGVAQNVGQDMRAIATQAAVVLENLTVAVKNAQQGAIPLGAELKEAVKKAKEQIENLPLQAGAPNSWPAGKNPLENLCLAIGVEIENTVVSGITRLGKLQQDVSSQFLDSIKSLQAYIHLERTSTLPTTDLSKLRNRIISSIYEWRGNALAILNPITTLQKRVASIPDFFQKHVDKLPGGNHVGLFNKLKGIIDKVSAETKKINELPTYIDNKCQELATKLATTHPPDYIFKEAEAFVGVIIGLQHNIDVHVEDFIDETRKDLKNYTSSLKDECGVLYPDIHDYFGKGPIDLIKAPLSGVQKHIDSLNDQLSGTLSPEKLNQVIKAVIEQGDALKEEAANKAAALGKSLADVLGRIPPAGVAAAQSLYQQGSDTLRLIRAVGGPPNVDSLAFNRPALAYFFKEGSKFVDMTPAVALVNRAAAGQEAAQAVDRLLRSFGLRLPTSQLGEQLMPDALKNLSVSQLFPDMAGLKLDNIFPGLAFPDLPSAEHVVIRHGYEKTEQRAWLEAKMDVPFNQSARVFALGPVDVVLDKARFTASATFEAGLDGRMQRNVAGQILGDWRVNVASTPVLRFVDARLRFDDNGHIDFAMDPNRIRLADNLQFLVDLLQKYQGKSPVRFAPLGTGGVAAILALRLPALQTGAFGVTDLALNGSFGIMAAPEFEILLDMALSSPLAPFTINIAILNGGGYLTTRTRYNPSKGQLAFGFSVAVAAGLGLGLELGPISGGVWVQAGIEAHFQWLGNQGSAQLTLSLFILIRGHVSLCGIVDCSIALLLTASYNSANGSLVGRGYLRVSIKISFFWTLDIEERIEYTLAGSPAKDNDNYANCLE